MARTPRGTRLCEECDPPKTVSLTSYAAHLRNTHGIYGGVSGKPRTRKQQPAKRVSKRTVKRQPRKATASMVPAAVQTQQLNGAADVLPGVVQVVSVMLFRTPDGSLWMAENLRRITIAD